MRIHGHASLRRSRLAQLTPAAALAIALAACSSSASTATQTTGTQPAAVTSTAAASLAPASSSPPAAATGLSGRWSGHYSGASQGNFTLNWRQSGSALNGTIKLETDGIGMPIHGIVHGDSIQFGTVGSTGITYKGTVAGNSMSGTYQLIANGATFSGPWTAAKSA